MNKDTIEINGEIYTKQKPNGNRAVVVIDRGWIFAGDVTEENGRIMLNRAVWVKSWSSVWFSGVLNNPKADEVNIELLNQPVDIPSGSEVFRVPVCEDWGCNV